MAIRTRVDRARASAGIAMLALQQIEDELARDDVTAQELAEIVRELHREADPQEGLFGALAQLLTVAARTAERLEPDRDGDASCALHEAAALITDNAGLRAYYATRALDPQGERAP
uniref:hypothetical protein n=1 Tax=Streptomyces antimycoticus TaxID=68175 RepID=UPI002F90A4BC|nr:hypothetical protein OG546_50120 [Streptomyces antimycoticus]